MNSQKVLGFYDASHLFTHIRNYCTAAGHNYSITADTRAIMCKHRGFFC